jgi:hypothetical protein
MDTAVAPFAFLCLAGILAVVGAHGYLKEAQAEFQSRLRNAALARARHLLLGAVLAWSGAGLLAAFATPETADAASAATLAEPPRNEPVQLRLDDDINFTGR